LPRAHGAAVRPARDCLIEKARRNFGRSRRAVSWSEPSQVEIEKPDDDSDSDGRDRDFGLASCRLATHAHKHEPERFGDKVSDGLKS